MKLPHLTQHVLLDRGMASLVFKALDTLETQLVFRDPQTCRWTTTEALSLKPLASLIKRVYALVYRDRQPLKLPAPTRTGRPRKPKPPKPHRLRVEYDEMAMVREFYARLLATAIEPTHYDQLATALGRFHQPSLNLETHIRLPAPTGPGCQTSWL